MRILKPLALLFVVACGPAFSDAPAVDNETASAAIAVAYCERLSACSAVVFQLLYPDEATCEARQKTNRLNELAAPSTGNNANEMSACAQAYPSVSCDILLNNEVFPAPCQSKTGELPNGAACAFAGQCQSAFCTAGDAENCGTCADAPQAGAACADGTTCGPGLDCSRAQTCAIPLLTVGASCNKSTACGAGYTCGGLTSTTNGTCQPIVATAAPGNPCGLIGGTYTLCKSRGYCRSDTSGDPLTCLAAAADGQACNESEGPLCVPPARCVNGTCQFADASSCH